MGRDVASSLKWGLRDEIGSVKETKIALSFQTLEYETLSRRGSAPNPAFRLDLPLSGQSFAPTNGTRRPAGRCHEISQQSKQVIPRTDIPLPPSRSRTALELRSLLIRPTHRIDSIKSTNAPLERTNAPRDEQSSTPPGCSEGSMLHSSRGLHGVTSRLRRGRALSRERQLFGAGTYVTLPSAGRGRVSSDGRYRHACRWARWACSVRHSSRERQRRAPPPHLFPLASTPLTRTTTANLARSRWA